MLMGSTPLRERFMCHTLRSWPEFVPHRCCTAPHRTLDGAHLFLLLGRKVSCRAIVMKGAVYDVGRYHPDLPRLRPGIYFHQWRAGFLCQPRVQRTEPV